VLDVSGGYTKLHEVAPTIVQTIRGPRELPQAQTPSGAVWRVELSRQTSPSSRLSLHATKQVTDAANLFRLNLDQPVPSSVADRLTTATLSTDRELGASGDLRRRAPRSHSATWTSASATRSTHLRPQREGRERTPRRQLSPVLNWDIGAEFERQDFAFGGRSNTVNAITSLRWQIARSRLAFSIRPLRTHAARYAENQVGVTASYAFLEGTAGSTQPGVQPAAPPP